MVWNVLVRYDRQRLLHFCKATILSSKNLLTKLQPCAETICRFAQLRWGKALVFLQLIFAPNGVFVKRKNALAEHQEKLKKTKTMVVRINQLKTRR